MRTKLTRFADGLMEAVWLTALIVVPVFFNIYSSRIFEPDKIAMMRGLVLLGLGAWVVEVIEQGGIDWGRLAPRPGESRLRALLKAPLVPAVLGLVAVYLVATLFSVTPRISFLGSYQRLQGTYTTLSYIVLFALVAVHMRRRAQIERLVTTVILASLPVGLYGIIQKYQIDPIPWGGDTSRRVAANMGNAIFVAAYLIMAIPLAIGRIVDSFTHILDESQTNLIPQIARGTIYVFIAAIQLIGIYFSLSRGPILGLLAGVFFMFLLLSLYWGRRWLTVTTVAAAGAVGVFLVVLSIPGGPLDSLRSNENIGRLGNVFETDSGTGRVRTLIWEGAAELVWFHEPLRFPDGSSDSFSSLRPFIGFGPEAMYVAYNPVYPPELASIEARNASPDRSHNETWDALVITGMLGLAAEQTLFIAVFFYGLKWLGLLSGPRQRRLFLGLILGGGALSSLGFSLLAETGFLGVGLPFGMLLGLLVYITLIAVFGRYDRPESSGERTRALTLMMFLGAVIAHYVEIHFGIAIAATRLHFWIYCGVLLASGYWMTRAGAYGPAARERLDGGEDLQGSAAEELPAESRSKRRTRGRRTGTGWARHAWISGVLGGILLSVLNFDYLTNTNRVISTSEIIRQSLTQLANKDFVVSYGILAIFLTFWLAASILAASEWARSYPADWRSVFLTTALVSAGIWLLDAFIHAGGLARVVQAGARFETDTSAMDGIFRQATSLEGLLTRFGVTLLLLVTLLAAQFNRPSSSAPPRLAPATGRGLVAGAGVLLIVLFLQWQGNLRVIHADMVFKMADPFGRGNSADSWQVAVSLYQRANDYAPLEDHYYLFLGKGYLELSRLLQPQNPFQAQELLRQAQTDLERAQRINPLNTDHTANLARLYRFWSSVPGIQESPKSLLQLSSDYYARALELSPNNASIRNEWAVLYLQDLGDRERGVEMLMQSLAIDPYYNGTYSILGDLYAADARNSQDDGARQQAAALAATYYSAALARTENPKTRYLYAAALGGVYNLVQDYERSVAAYLEALDNADDAQVYLVEDTIAKIQTQAGNYTEALNYAARALEHAPAEQKETQQQLIDYILGLQSAP